MNYGSIYADLSGWATRPGAVTVLILSALILGFVGFSLFSKHRDQDIESRGATIILGMKARLYFSWLIGPLQSVLLNLGVPANAITNVSVLLAYGSGIAISAGQFSLGGWLFVVAGLCDALDGRLARARGSAGPQGAALDSVLDRFSDAAPIIGLAWYYRNTWVLAAALLALAGSLIVPYVRAKGESLGVKFPNIGIMQRPERVAILTATVTLSPVVELFFGRSGNYPPHLLAVVGIVVISLSSMGTAIQRLNYLLKSLGTSPKTNLTGKGSISRGAISSVLATGSDFMVVNLLVLLQLFSPVFATIVGSLLGALVNFGINRQWAYGVRGRYLKQASRYAAVSATSAVLNAGGLAIFLEMSSVDYRVGWWICRLAVFLFWNHPMQRDFVFSSPRPTLTKVRHTEVPTKPDSPRAITLQIVPEPETVASGASAISPTHISG